MFAPDSVTFGFLGRRDSCRHSTGAESGPRRQTSIFSHLDARGANARKLLGPSGIIHVDILQGDA
jgi:hypothetical protein